MGGRMPGPIRTSIVLTAVLVAAFVVAPPASAAPRCFGKKATIEGTGKRDRIKGTPGRDVIVARGGRDFILGRAGNDLICAGGGNDTIRGKKGNDRIDGGAGDDVFDGGGRAFDLAGFEHSPVGVVVDLNVTTPQVTNEGTDTIVATEGLFGSEFNDVLTGHNAPSTTGNGLFGFLGTDQLFGLDGDDTVDGGPGNDGGGPGVGILNGGPGNDIIFGDIGDDHLYGEAGMDLLDGFDGNDFGSGGPDLDVCVSIESVDTPPPEELPAGDTCKPATPREVLSRAERWVSVAARWRTTAG